MQLSTEGYRVRWLVLVSAWVLAAFVLAGQTGLVRDYLAIAGQLGLRGAPQASTPLKQIYPAFAADGQVWIRHSLSLLEGDSLRLRHTTIDNAPNGREVHWNSAWAWTVAGAGKLQQLFTGDTLTGAVEKAALWLNPAVLWLLLVLISSWVTRRAGLIAGLLVLVAMGSTDRILEGFFPTYVDHHGLLSVAALAMALGAMFMGGGWWQPATGGQFSLLPRSPDEARNSAVFSGFCGACGLWVSAASAIPPIALVGIAGAIVTVIQGRTAQAKGATFDPQTWRLWGRVGAGASILFYLIEYFPSDLGMRLEANHPLHAIAWLGGGELVAQIGERWLTANGRRWDRPVSLVWPLIAVAGVPAAILIGGSKVFIILDPFMSNLHHRYIQEFLPLWTTMRNFSGKMIFQMALVDNLPLIAAIATLTYWRRDAPLVLWFVTTIGLLLNAMGWWQSRWLLNASSAQICLTIVVIAVWTARYRPLVRWSVAGVVIGAMYVPTVVVRYTSSQADIKALRVSPKDALNVLYRDIATTLRASQPDGEITVLASPNASVGIGYYGRFKTLGTLYWENEPGLKAAARILAARTEQEAATLIQQHKVTHIALIAEENFIAQYHHLLHPTATAEEINQSFGLKILAEKVVPQWLQVLPYKVPDDLATMKPVVMLMKVNFQQSMPEAMYHVGLAQLAMDGVADAEKTFDAIIKQFPQFSEPWLRRGELYLRRHNWQEAAEHMTKGINQLPAEQRPALHVQAAGAFYKEGQPGIAIQIYKDVLSQGFNADAACYLAWVLSTTTVDALRNGTEALRLAQEAVKADPNSATYLNTLAAAFAECGKFPEAIAAADRALVNARLQGRADAVLASEQNLAVVRAHQPIRK